MRRYILINLVLPLVFKIFLYLLLGAGIGLLVYLLLGSVTISGTSTGNYSVEIPVLNMPHWRNR